MTAGRFMGQAVARTEDPRLLTGRGRYIADVVVGGASDAAFLRSEVARGRIVRLDAEAARSAPGVRAVYTAADLNPLVHDTSVAGLPDAPYPPKYCLAENDVRYVGDPIAIVVAENRYLAEDAVELIDVEIEPRIRCSTSTRPATPTSDVVHPELGTNHASGHSTVRPPRPRAGLSRTPPTWSETPSSCTATCKLPWSAAASSPIGSRSSDELTVWSSTQSVHGVQAFLAGLLGIGTNKVRVLQPDVGGGFGQKTMLARDEWAVVLAATLLGASGALDRGPTWKPDGGSPRARRGDGPLDGAGRRRHHPRHSGRLHREHRRVPGAGSSGMGAFLGAVSDERLQDPEGRFCESGGVHQYMRQVPYRGPFLMYAVASSS